MNVFVLCIAEMEPGLISATQSLDILRTRCLATLPGAPNCLDNCLTYRKISYFHMTKRLQNISYKLLKEIKIFPTTIRVLVTVNSFVMKCKLNFKNCVKPWVRRTNANIPAGWGHLQTSFQLLICSSWLYCKWLK